MHCNKLPTLSDPPAIAVFGINVVILDENGDLAILDSNVGAQTFLFNDVPAGHIYWKNLAPFLLPEADNTNNGFVYRVSGNTVAIMQAGIPYQNAANPGVDNTPGIITLGTIGQILSIDSLGIPVFIDFPTPAPATNQSIGNLDEAAANSTSVTAVNVRANQLSLFNGTDYITRTAVNVSADLAAPVGLGGLDSGTEASSTWYYMYVVSDGFNHNLMISTNPTQPNFGTTGYSYWLRIGAFRNDGSGDIVSFFQNGRTVRTRRVQVSTGEAITTNWELQTFDVAIATTVPPIAKTVAIQWQAGANLGVATDATTGGTANAVGTIEALANHVLVAENFLPKDPTAIQIYWKAAGATTGDSWVIGYNY